MLLRACGEVNVELVAFLLSSGANANFLEIDGSRPVHRAAHNSQILQRLGEKGADINLRDLNGETALHWAAREGSVGGVEWLLANGAVSTLHHESVILHYTVLLRTAMSRLAAFCWNRVQIASSTLLRRDLRRFHCAAYVGNLTVVEILLDFSADPWARNKWKDTPLHIASQMGHAEIVEKLLHPSAGAATLESVEENGRHPLHEAAAQNNATIYRMLLKAGAR
jgi:ankyrin repeat protein